MLNVISIWLASLYSYPCKYHPLNEEQVDSFLVFFRILERTSALVLELLQREEELKKTKTESSEITKGQQRLIDMEDDYKKQVDVLQVQIKELKRQQLDYATLKKQADQQQLEYSRLAEDFNKLEKSGSTETRKDI